jgi:hypothetical protein
MVDIRLSIVKKRGRRAIGASRGCTLRVGKTGVELVRVSDPSSTPAVSAEPSFRPSNPHGVFMSLSPKAHVPDARSPKPVTIGVRQLPGKPLAYPRPPALQLKSKSDRARLEYENPDLTLPSVSSF